MSTHYIPAFTHRDRWNQEQAVCGEWVDAKAHTNEPTCVECQQFLAQKATLDAELEATFADETTPQN